MTYDSEDEGDVAEDFRFVHGGFYDDEDYGEHAWLDGPDGVDDLE